MYMKNKYFIFLKLEAFGLFMKKWFFKNAFFKQTFFYKMSLKSKHIWFDLFINVYM